MKKATYNDKKIVIHILTLSFYDNQSVNYIISEKHNKTQIKALMDYSFEQCYLFGSIYLSDDMDACALILYPQKKHFSFKAIWLDINLIFKAIGVTRIFKALKREAAIKKLQPKIDMAYLWFIGVMPSSQHTGIGSKLLTEIIEAKTKEHLPVFLETSTVINLPWYKRFGFEIYAKLEMGYTLFFLKVDQN
ncbi:GNAT superfamily N-acetyltransferase [Mucilaginibacter sp. OAE612]|uniref:GNAT family N-acetyltransferase n=1 Tax=Mucilaginibacter sp. OAE612 TaxID=3156444 RepID=UPI00359DCFB2